MAEFTFTDLKSIIVNRIGLDESSIPDNVDTSYEELGLDSLALIELQIEVEQRFGFRMAEEDSEKIRTFRDSIDYVNLRLAEAH